MIRFISKRYFTEDFSTLLLNDKLKSLFEWSKIIEIDRFDNKTIILFVDIETPDLELKIKIIRKKKMNTKSIQRKYKPKWWSCN